MNRYFKILILCLLVKSAIACWAIQTRVIELGPDEAQYWTWSQNLDWGYYSKPPGIAWQIWLGTQMLGNTELGVRLMSVVIAFLLPLCVYFLARACRLKTHTAFWAGMVMAFSPLGVMAPFLATTDGGLILFWTLASILVAKALSKGSTPNYYLLGVVLMAGALFKWPIYFFWIFVLLALPMYHELRSRRILWGMAISLLGLLPSIAWNSAHDWATFRHVLATMKGGQATSVVQGNFFDFLGAQAGLLSPILFVLLLLAFVAMIKNITKVWPSVLFCGMVCLLLLASFSTLALFKKMQGNWSLFAYPTGIILLSWFACERVRWGRSWLIGGVVLSVVLCLSVLSLPALQARGLIPLPYKANPFKHNLGWTKLSKEIESAGYDPKEHFLFGDKYQMTSILSFYSPGQKRAYFLNLQGARQNQFSYWPGMEEEQLGGTGFFVLAENSPHLEREFPKRIKAYQSQLEEYFEEVLFLGTKPLFSQGNTVVKGAIIFKCLNYNGKIPATQPLY